MNKIFKLALFIFLTGLISCKSKDYNMDSLIQYTNESFLIKDNFNIQYLKTIESGNNWNKQFCLCTDGVNSVAIETYKKIDFICDSLERGKINDKQAKNFIDTVVNNCIINMNSYVLLYKKYIYDYQKYIKNAKNEIPEFCSNDLSDLNNYKTLSKWKIQYYRHFLIQTFYNSISVDDFVHPPLKVISISENTNTNQGNIYTTFLYPCVCGDESYFYSIKLDTNKYKTNNDHLLLTVMTKNKKGNYSLIDSIGIFNSSTGITKFYPYYIKYQITE